MLPLINAITICWSFNYTSCFQILQTTAHVAAAIACLTMPFTLYQARRRGSDSMLPFLAIASAFTLCLGLNQIVDALTLWAQPFIPNNLQALWALTSAVICIVAARSLHDHAADLLATRQELVSIRALAKTDPLTGLENRQGFNEGLEHAIQNGAIAGKKSTLMLVDLDGFKSANDTYGHLVGDHILQRVAQILQRHARRSDCVARLGGDEFAIIWNQCDLENAKVLAENIRRDIEELWLPQTPKNTGLVTASIGLATVDPTITATRMYELTDRTLYISKREGKNQVSWMPTPEALAMVDNCNCQCGGNPLKPGVRPPLLSPLNQSHSPSTLTDTPSQPHPPQAIAHGSTLHICPPVSATQTLDN